MPDDSITVLPQRQDSLNSSHHFPIKEFLYKKYEQLSETDRKLFTYGPMYLGINSAFSGLIANSLFRRVLNVSQGRLTSSLPMAVLPGLTTMIAYSAAVSTPLVEGHLNCPTCALVRGGLVGAVVGGLYPILLALPVNAGLATRYNTSPMPEKGNIFRFWAMITQPVLKKMSFVIILQGMFGIYMSSKHYGIYMKMLEQPLSDEDIKE
ncbi:transmembrane protein 126A [Polypterus senegalus]|uniref:transmembrane protein 126A n=1 Tax=Polypterus senegalus TaxID=55291 RepID=UPI0019637409|nr:transmembrane protein 126A [Polypterus senegalus]XP_039600321.1 transmembrane protein 126A [Polypterus senegalus]